MYLGLHSVCLTLCTAIAQGRKQKNSTAYETVQSETTYSSYLFVNLHRVGECQ